MFCSYGAEALLLWCAINLSSLRGVDHANDEPDVNEFGLIEFSISYRSYGADVLCYCVLLTFRPSGAGIMQLMSPMLIICVDGIVKDYRVSWHGAKVL